jgi:D-aminopeptidase
MGIWLSVSYLHTRTVMKRFDYLTAVVVVLLVGSEMCGGLRSNAAENRGQRPRAREIGIAPGVLRPGPHNAITDVSGVLVGHVTLVEGDDIRTGVTSVLSHGGNLYREKVPAGIAVGNGYGKFAGTTQIDELGEVETPIILTNTLAVAEGIAGVVEWTLAAEGNENVRSVNAVVG